MVVENYTITTTLNEQTTKLVAETHKPFTVIFTSIDGEFYVAEHDTMDSAIDSICSGESERWILDGMCHNKIPQELRFVKQVYIHFINKE